MSRLTHLDEKGAAHMVDVSAKQVSVREAAAEGRIRMSREAADAIRNQAAAKGDVLAVDRIAGIMAAKKTAADRKGAGEGKRVSDRVDCGGGRTMKKKKHKRTRE